MRVIVRMCGASDVDVFTEDELRKRFLSPHGGKRGEWQVEDFFKKLDEQGYVVEYDTVYYRRTLNIDGTEPEGGF